MWKRDDVRQPDDNNNDVEEHPLAGLASAGAPRRAPVAERAPARDVVNIGKSVIIKGELSGSENLTIEGQFEGKIELRDNVLTVGPNGKIKAEMLFAKSVDILGRVTGKIMAVDVVSIRENGAVDGDITAPRIAIADGAHFRGSVDMRRDSVEAKPKEPAAIARAPVAPKGPVAPPATTTPQPGQAPMPKMGRAAGGGRPVR
jgi:cytoskeletal protein CcmA (bactofilin family)